MRINLSAELASILRQSPELPYYLGVYAEAQNVHLSTLTPLNIQDYALSAELSDRTAGGRHPLLAVSCTRIANTRDEKFRTFSGKAELQIEIRLSHEKPDQLSRLVQVFTTAVCEVLNVNRGEWKPGLYYPGGYEVSFLSPKFGGRSFTQSATIKLSVHLAFD